MALYYAPLHYFCRVKFRINTLFLLLFFLFLGVNEAYSAHASDSLEILQRVLNYKQLLCVDDDTISTNMYLRYSYRTDRRNFTLVTIPTMHSIASGGREFAGESFSDIRIANGVLIDSERLLNIGTIPRYRTVMPTTWKYLMPNIYEKTLFDGQVLSPFSATNTKLYKYKINILPNNVAEITFRRRRVNTQLVNGSALVERSTGKILWVNIRGEYDMIIFYINAQYNEQGAYSLFPKTCDINAIFSFLGNKITASYHSVYDNPVSLPDSILNSHDVSLMEEVRPSPLPDDIKAIYHKDDSIKNYRDSTGIQPNKDWGKILWNSVGEHVVKRTKGNFGAEDQGSFRLSPLLNPLYVGYSRRKGITYKLKFRGNYNFTPNRDLSIYIRAGYYFKLRQLYFNIPLTFNYNKRKNAYVQFDIGNGNRINYSNVINKDKVAILDSIGRDTKDMKTFRDFYMKLVNNYDFNSKWGGQIGIVYHKRTAVDKEGFSIAGIEPRYYSVAPWVELRYRPWGWDGPRFSVDYERGLKLGKADLVYERIEIDAIWKRPFNRLRSLSMRLGGGFYTHQGKGSHFLDFTNFRDETIPQDWNEDWAGSFQLLGSERYNSSKYYVRANVTYESPLMLLSYIPIVGRLMEEERIYINGLIMQQMHPYVEVGYGFTTRLISLGAFIAMRNTSYDGIGCRVALELFRDW